MTSLDSAGSSAAGASLSTLSNALEKLRMPPSSRPNTSMGFNPDIKTAPKTAPRDDSALGATFKFPKPDGVKRSVTLGSGAVKTAAGSKNLVQKPLAMFMSKKGTMPGGTRGSVPSKPNSSVKPLFGLGGHLRRTVSKKTTLPMVIGSPVKGGGESAEPEETTHETREELEDIIVGEKSGNDSAVFDVPLNSSTGSITQEVSPKGKAKEKSKVANASRRVSMLSHALARSLSELPPAQQAGPSTSTKGLMGPPETPPSARLKTGGSGKVSASPLENPSSSPSQAETSGIRSSSRIATKNAQAKVSNETPISAGRKSTDGSTIVTPQKQETLKILNECKIFVDVRTDGGDEAGSLFVEMLEGLGAKVFCLRFAL